jgi:uncharacterized protein YfkK (UPF0435 family)
VSVGQTICWELGGRWINVVIRDIVAGSTERAQLPPEHGIDQQYRIDRKTTTIDIRLKTPVITDPSVDVAKHETLTSLVDMIRKTNNMSLDCIEATCHSLLVC